MTLIRGVQGKYPCPICLVPKEDQGNLLIEHELRSGEESERLVRQSMKMARSEAEELLKKQSLRPVMVCSISGDILPVLIDFSMLLCRMHSGKLHSRILIEPLHLTRCMLMMVVLVESIFGHLFKLSLISSQDRHGRMQNKKLITSMSKSIMIWLL